MNKLPANIGEGGGTIWSRDLNEYPPNCMTTNSVGWKILDVLNSKQDLSHVLLHMLTLLIVDESLHAVLTIWNGQKAQGNTSLPNLGLSFFTTKQHANCFAQLIPHRFRRPLCREFQYISLYKIWFPGTLYQWFSNLGPRLLPIPKSTILMKICRLILYTCCMPVLCNRIGKDSKLIDPN